MKMKKVLALVLIAILSLSCFIGCSSKENELDAVPAPEAEEEQENTAEKDVEIWVIDSTSVMQYHKIFKSGCEAAAADLGVKLVYQAPTVSDDVPEHSNIIETAIGAKADAICVNPIDLEAVVGPVEHAKEAGIPVLCVDRGINSDIPVTTVATNDLDATKVLAEEVGEAMNGVGSVLVIGHDNVSKNGQERTYGFIDALNELYPDIQVADTQFGMDVAQVTDQAKSMLTAHPEATLIYGTCEPTVQGILNAVTELGLEHKVLVAGYDAGTMIKDAVRNGVMMGAIAQSPYAQGYTLVETAYEYLNGKTDIPKVINAQFYFYDAENMDDPDIAACLYD